MSTVAIAPGHRLQFEEAQGRYVLLYPEGMVELSDSAADVLAHMVEPTSVESLLAGLGDEYAVDPAELAADVQAFLEDAHGRGWITLV